MPAAISAKEKKKLREIYYNVSNPASFGGVEKLVQKSHLERNKVKKWLNEEWPYSLHKPVRRNFPRRKYVSRGMNHQWQADLVEMQKYSRENQGYRYILTLIDIFSRYAYAVPLKNKTGPVVAAALNTILSSVPETPKYLQCDQGLEFYNSHVKNLLEKYNIELFSVYSEKKAAVIERFNRTLKEKMFRVFTYRGNYIWHDILSQLVDSYNNSYHRGLKHIPANVNERNETDVWIKQYANLKEGAAASTRKAKFKVGDKVRITKHKTIFSKGYLQNWSDEVFTIVGVNRKYYPLLYTLSDSNNEEIKGSFYENELQKVESKIYRLERIIRTRTRNGVKEALVKWIGYKTPTWINYSNITTVN